MDKRIGAQLYTLRDYCKTKEDLEETFKKLKSIGYKTVQLSAIGDIDPHDIRALCDKYELEPICTHKGYNDYIDNLEGMNEYHKIIGCKIAGIGAMPESFRNPQGFKDFVKEFTPVCKAFRDAGMTFAYHNHGFEFMKDNGKFLMDTLVEDSDFDFILDVYWLAFSGIDPASFIKKIGKRAIVVHFKDLIVENFSVTMSEVMEGNLNWDSIIAACEEAGCQYAMVEQDVCKGNPFDSMKISYDNLKTKGFC